jgi:Holliday junction resolvase RusA-like endonuclease
MQTLVIHGMPMNLTKYRNCHHYSLNNHKKEWSEIVKTAVMVQGIQPMNRIIMTYEFFFKDRRRHDPDNYACCAKFINDALVECGILKDDTFEYIVELRMRQGGIQKDAGIFIHMEEV